MTRALTRSQIDHLAQRIADLLADPDAGLSPDARLRWEGALTACEIILGRPPSLPTLGVADDIATLL